MRILPLLLFLTACTPLNPPPVTDPATLTNQLSRETSPYLLQHAGNPVAWQAWNAETLARAQRENKLLIVSVGYAACHWCHVMEHESFEDTTVARLMNDYFIPVKVDREERPDVDDIYMTACNLVTGRGGWPLNAFALPDGRPVWAGTYFPREQWIEVLKQFADMQQNDPARLEEAAENLTQNIRQADELVAVNEAAELEEAVLKEFDANLLKVLDYQHGGRKGAPKFPMPSIYEYLVLRFAQTGDERLWRITELTLDRMARGGIYDQAGGGFARYSVDARWMAPHFEKMLYDNGQLVGVYARAYQHSGKELYRRRLERDPRLCGPRDERPVAAAVSTPRWTPTARARRASFTCGRLPNCVSCCRRTPINCWPIITPSRRMAIGNTATTSCTARTPMPPSPPSTAWAKPPGWNGWTGYTHN